jgi:hypothetical protein
MNEKLKGSVMKKLKVLNEIVCFISISVVYLTHYSKSSIADQAHGKYPVLNIAGKLFKSCFYIFWESASGLESYKPLIPENYEKICTFLFF